MISRAMPRTLLSVHGEPERREDLLAIEEPLEIRVQAPGEAPVQIAVTMRTPGHDAELAIGFLVTEGLLTRREQLGTPVVRELTVEGGVSNIATVRVTEPFDATRLKRNFYATSSCGVCGKAALEHIHTTAPAIAAGPILGRSVLLGLPGALRAAQVTFAQTGGLHATAAFDAQGTLLLAREDVGRHNAMDKVIGRLVMDGGLPFSNGVLLVSGRASFELVQKAAMAAVPILCAVSAPSSLAVLTAERVGMTLAGFLREGGFNLYTRAERVDTAG
ncbi:MAG: formate dehydrogenase accessory sulfurtransferase FdhD [Myxococcales bacterium]|nr:formate dehydrogenase accessory sulfurtransferase FdhD [Myxococcales bacterium]